MQRILFIPIISLLVFFNSCKKDLLHWQNVQKLESNTKHDLQHILFVNDTLGFIVGGQRFFDADILTTYDGGHNFTYRTFPEAGKALYGAVKGGDETLYAIGFDGKMLMSKDFGASWSFKQLNYDPYKSIAVTAKGGIVVGGGISFETGFIYRGDANGNYTSRDTALYEINDVVMFPNGQGYMSGYGIMAKTIDDGATWKFQSANNDNFKKMDAISATEIWVCGYNGSIYHTTNGGADWNQKRNGNDLSKPRYHLTAVHFINEKEGYAVGEDGLVIYSDDAGEHWMELDRFTDKHLQHIAECPNGDLLICGEQGTLYRVLKK